MSTETQPGSSAEAGQARDEQENERLLQEAAELDSLSNDAAVWVFIVAFVGMAVGWSTHWFAPWLGAVAGGIFAFLMGALIIALRDQPGFQPHDMKR